MIIRPTEVEAAIKDISTYWKSSKSSKADKLQVLDMLSDHYTQLSVNYEGDTLPGIYDTLRQIVNSVIKANK